MKPVTGPAPAKGQVRLSAGKAMVLNPAVTTDTLVYLAVKQPGTVVAPQPITVTAITAGAFSVASTDDTDTSLIAYMLGS